MYRAECFPVPERRETRRRAAAKTVKTSSQAPVGILLSLLLTHCRLFSKRQKTSFQWGRRRARRCERVQGCREPERPKPRGEERNGALTCKGAVKRRECVWVLTRSSVLGSPGGCGLLVPDVAQRAKTAMCRGSYKAVNLEILAAAACTIPVMKPFLKNTGNVVSCLGTQCHSGAARVRPAQGDFV